VIHPIRLYGDPTLRRSAAPVERFDDELAELANDMIETMHDAHGVGLAAPQIGISRRIFVATELAAPETDPTGDDSEPAESRAVDEAMSEAESEVEDAVVAIHIMVNPEVTIRSGVQHGPDGCLSVPGLWVEEVRRDATIGVRYQDVSGAWHERETHGHFAHVVQHELDHLDGVLYFDRLPTDERQAFLDEHRSALAEMQRQAKALLKELRAADTVGR